MKWADQYRQLSNQSDFHEAARHLFCTDPNFKHFKCYQEVNCKELLPDYPYHNHHYDWFIREMGVVLELHGEQHYKPTKFGGTQSYDDTLIQFRRMQFRDNMKATAAIDAGYTYIAIPYKYKNKLSYELLKEYLQ